MSQTRLFFAGIEEAAEEIARHYPDGPKALAARLRPTKSPDAAYRWWLDCCNVNRTEHNFAGEDWLALIKIGREIGCHAVMHFVCDESNYERAQPVEPEDESNALRREFINAVKQQSRLLERIERLEQQGTSLRSVK